MSLDSLVTIIKYAAVPVVTAAALRKPIAVALMRTAEALLEWMNCPGAAEDISKIRESLLRKEIAGADASTADAQKRLADAATAANKAIQGNLKLREQQFELEQKKSQVEEERHRAQANEKALNRLADALSRLRQEGGQLFLDPEYLAILAKQRQSRPKRAATKKTKRRGAVLALSVADLELSVRTRKALQGMKIKTIGELVSRTEDDLLGAKNFGHTSLTEIKQQLAQYGLSLKKMAPGA